MASDRLDCLYSNTLVNYKWFKKKSELKTYTLLHILVQVCTAYIKHFPLAFLYQMALVSTLFLYEA